MSRPPLIVIAGPTASGKSALALKLAQLFGGEIVCADSRTVYRGLDIGTGKPTIEEQALVPHHILDVADPSNRFTASDFKLQAVRAIDDIRARGKVPFLVGGTGLYIDSIVYDYSFVPAKDELFVVKRVEMEGKTIEELHNICINNNIGLPINSKNKRHLVRWIETDGDQLKSKRVMQPDTFVVAITTNKEVLLGKIRQRAEHFLNNGVVDEAMRMSAAYSWDIPALSGNIYPLIRQHLECHTTKDDLVDKITTADWQLAKRQLTWLRRSDDVKWMTVAEAETHLCGVLSALEI